MLRAVVCSVTFLAYLSVPAQAAALDKLTYHGDSQRTGWNANEVELTPHAVSGPQFGLLWQTEEFDSFDGTPPRLYASPLYVDRVKISSGRFQGGTYSVVFAATSTGYVYAVNAFAENNIPAGTTLWRTRLDDPCTWESEQIPPDGVLSTPVIDSARSRLYVTSCRGTGMLRRSYAAYALDIASGEILPGWPVTLDRATFNSPGMNRNAPIEAEPENAQYDASEKYLGYQRGALNLSPDDRFLYVTFGESIPGWIAAVDTAAAAIATTFATVAVPHGTNGGIWGAGGPAIDAYGNVFVVTGTWFNGFIDQPHDWVQSLLKLANPEPGGFVLRGTYTPFNYCQTATMDIDLGSGGALVIPDLDSDTTSTPRLMAFGGKQGNLYLLDRDRLPGRLDTRQPCSEDSTTDQSLLAPGNQPHFNKRGPLNVFGPYSEEVGAMDQAKSRSMPAYFHGSNGRHYLVVSGSTKNGIDSIDTVPPCLARVRIVTARGEPAFLEIEQYEQTLVFENPGSPVISSNGTEAAIVWVLDENAPRSSPLYGDSAPKPILYAIDALTFKVLWRSRPGELYPSGKYNEPTIARGTVFVGTDRVQAFGLR